LRWWGVVSYSAYLLHGPIVNGVCNSVEHLLRNRFPIVASFYLALLIAWVCVFAISYMFYRFIELPSAFLGKHLTRRWRQESPA
jgi:peptidoglycan/LPS O-acetylase OafA/YrhL